MIYAIWLIVGCNNISEPLNNTNDQVNGSIEGVARNSLTQAIPSKIIQVALLKLNSGTSKYDSIRFANTMETGRYSFTGLLPGEYLVRAVIDNYVKKSFGVYVSISKSSIKHEIGIIYDTIDTTPIQLVDILPLKVGDTYTYFYNYSSGTRYYSDFMKTGIVTYEINSKSENDQFINWNIVEKESSQVHYKSYYAGNIDTMYVFGESLNITLTEYKNGSNHLIRGKSKSWDFDSYLSVSRFSTLLSDTGNVYNYVQYGGPISIAEKIYMQKDIGIKERYYSYYQSSIAAYYVTISVQRKL